MLSVICPGDDCIYDSITDSKHCERLEERRGNTRIQLPSFCEFVSVLNQRQLLIPHYPRMNEHGP